MSNQHSKIFYKIGDVSEFVGVPQSTLRYWEKEFGDFVKPVRNAGNTRFYRDEDIEMLNMIKYLLHDRGMKIDAVKSELRLNKKNISRRMKILDTLTEVRDELTLLLKSLNKRK